MFNYIKYLYCYLYNILFGLNPKEPIETESEYVERELNDWKLKMYSNNSYLIYIPEKRILLEKQRLQKEYNKN